MYTKSIKNKSLLFCILISVPLYSVFPEGMIEKQGEIKFRDFPWGTSIEEFVRKEGQPDEIEEKEDKILTYQNIKVAGYDAMMTASFSANELAGGAYAIKCETKESFQECSKDIDEKLSIMYGMNPAREDHDILKLSLWRYTGGIITLMTINNPDDDIGAVTIMYFSPALAREVLGSSGL